VVAVGARCLQQAREGEADRQPARGDGERVAPPEVLHVVQDAIAVGVAQPPARALDALRRLLHRPGGLILALLT
jgi:hypothetical protein